MRHSLVALALLAAGAPAPAFAQASRPGPAQPVSAGVYRDVLALREQVRGAVAGKDRPALEALYLDNFRHLRDSGRADLKAERIALLLKGESTIETAPEDGFEVQTFGSGTAVATGTSTVLDSASGRSAPFRWLTVYVKDGERWRVALSQASRVRR